MQIYENNSTVIDSVNDIGRGGGGGARVTIQFLPPTCPGNLEILQ